LARVHQQLRRPRLRPNPHRLVVVRRWLTELQRIAETSADAGPLAVAIDDVRGQDVELVVEGEDGFRLSEASQMRKISRDVLDLVSQTINENHQYPDGLALFTGTLFAPTQDRDGKGKGFTHKLGDVVRIRSEKLGTLQNRVAYCDRAPRWEFGISALMKNLHARGLLK
jgi:fumarylacetoacetate (FAA) hydrolase family protein